MKRSGYGKGMSVYGLEDYSVVRHVMFKHWGAVDAVAAWIVVGAS